MKSSDLDRRKFLKHTATAGAVGAGVSATGLSAAVLSNAEVQEWNNRVGASFRHEGAELVLQSVNATDRTADSARPRQCRAHEISMLFVLKSGSVDANDQNCFELGAENGLRLSKVVAPQGEVGEYYEAILN